MNHDAREQALAGYVASLDVPALARRFHDDDGALILPGLLPPALLDEMVAEGRALLPQAIRRHVPFVRKAGAIDHFAIEGSAPALAAVHRSPSLRALFERVSGVPLDPRASTEQHASALYAYTEPGDFIGWHTDECGCAPGDSFSTVIGLVDRSSSRLEIETRRDRSEPVRHAIATAPGTFIFLCGTRAHHRVTPLGPGEERLTFAFSYVRRGRKPGGIYNVRLKIGNALLYFGRPRRRT